MSRIFRSGYFVFAGHERRGPMKGALRLVVRRVFSKMKLHRLEANIQPRNAASKALVKACGFINESYSERYLKIGGARAHRAQRLDSLPATVAGAARIAILISHRFSTVRYADQIVVLEEGRVIEQGSHEELMRLGGRYARLFDLQARAYR